MKKKSAKKKNPKKHLQKKTHIPLDPNFLLGLTSILKFLEYDISTNCSALESEIQQLKQKVNVI